jgi:hypothetical protein
MARTRSQVLPNRGDAYDEPAQPEEQPRRLLQEYRLGRVKAVIWLNETQLEARHSVQFFRLYKPDGAEHWQNTTSFNRDDLPLVAKLADLAMMYIYGSMQSEGI